MYTTNIIREYMTKMLSKKNKTDAVIINMTKYESWQTRPEDTRIIEVVKKDEINIQNSLEYIMIDPYDMLWYVKKETNNINVAFDNVYNELSKYNIKTTKEQVKKIIKLFF